MISPVKPSTQTKLVVVLGNQVHAIPMMAMVAVKKQGEIREQIAASKRGMMNTHMHIIYIAYYDYNSNSKP